MRAKDAGSRAACAGPHSCHTPPDGLPRRGARAENCSKPKSRINPRRRPCGMLQKLAAPAQISASRVGWRWRRRGPPSALPEAWPRWSPKPAVRAKVTKLHDPSTSLSYARLAGPPLPVPRARSTARPQFPRGPGPGGGVADPEAGRVPVEGDSALLAFALPVGAVHGRAADHHCGPRSWAPPGSGPCRPPAGPTRPEGARRHSSGRGPRPSRTARWLRAAARTTLRPGGRTTARASRPQRAASPYRDMRGGAVCTERWLRRTSAARAGSRVLRSGGAGRGGAIGSGQEPHASGPRPRVPTAVRRDGDARASAAPRLAPAASRRGVAQSSVGATLRSVGDRTGKMDAGEEGGRLPCRGRAPGAARWGGGRGG